MCIYIYVCLCAYIYIYMCVYTYMRSSLTHSRFTSLPSSYLAAPRAAPLTPARLCRKYTYMYVPYVYI